jgi:hypothetical protein
MSHSGHKACESWLVTKLALIPIEGPEKATKCGGEWDPIKIPQRNLAYVPSSNPKTKTLQECDEHTNQQRKQDPLKDTNAVKKEWDQLDIRLARYGQNREQRSSWKTHLYIDMKLLNERSYWKWKHKITEYDQVKVNHTENMNIEQQKILNTKDRKVLNKECWTLEVEKIKEHEYWTTKNTEHKR